MELVPFRPALTDVTRVLVRASAPNSAITLKEATTLVGGLPTRSPPIGSHASMLGHSVAVSKGTSGLRTDRCCRSADAPLSARVSREPAERNQGSAHTGSTCRTAARTWLRAEFAAQFAEVTVDQCQHGQQG